ncbi:MAG: RNA-dependent RNA polymerase [Hangzhou zicrona caerulea phasmavirus 1]|nr:MAG: RNA-dependent RNA polymerase [Hangzhou zicrona caerulea phasmavirus 1]
MERAYQYVGKVDRNRQEEKRLRELNVFSIQPRTDSEACLYDIYKKLREVNEGELPVDDALQMYLNSRMLRHDVWVDLLHSLRHLHHYKFGDIRLRDFVSSTRENYGIILEEPDVDITNKTPDILLYNPGGKYFIVGDVAVTVAFEQVRKDKYLKYKAIEDYFKKNGQNVKWLSLIIKDDLSNVRSMLNEFIVNNVIDCDESRIERSVRYHTLAQNIMVDCKVKVNDRILFEKKLSYEDRISDLYDEEAIPDINIEMDSREPSISEDIIIDWIREETEKKLESNFFDNSIEDTVDAFNELINNYKECKPAKPKSVLKIVANCHDYTDEVDHNLIKSYVLDIMNSDNCDVIVQDYALSILPTTKQIDDMIGFKNKLIDVKKTSHLVYGPYQYNRHKSQNPLIIDMEHKLKKGKRLPNDKKEPTSIHPDNHTDCINFINDSIEYLGSTSRKMPFLSDNWDATTQLEVEMTKEEHDIYDYVRTTNASQLAHSLSNLYQRILHTKTSFGNKDNIYTPPNGSFVVIMPKEHAPVNTKSCDMPFIFMTRYRRGDKPKHIEYDYKLTGLVYDYYISKLCRLNIDKITCWDQAGYRLVACATYLLSKCVKLRIEKVKTVGILTYMMLDSHQKTSEYLDLFKYISYMPFADLSRLSALIRDKMNIMTKTSLDIWLLYKIKDFILELNKIELANPSKPRLTLFNAKITRESLGLNLNLPSFIENSIRHKSVEDFVEEITLLNIMRPKHLYGSQFMYKSVSNTVEWNEEFHEEIDKYGSWATTGEGEGKYPFNAKFCFSRDAIIYAQRKAQEKYGIQSRKVAKKLSQIKYNTFMHNNCSLRGCTKEPEDRKNDHDLHTTSIEACLKYYAKNNYNDEQCTSLSIAEDFINSNKVMQFSMSEKDQRGGGRPIATPTLLTKATLMALDKPEQAIGTFTPNNVIVEGKNKLKEQSETYKDLVSSASLEGFKYVFQLTEDQSKWSENDNTRKFLPYIAHNTLLSKEVRKLQYASCKKLENREHLVHRLPDTVKDDPKLKQYINEHHNGVKIDIGWPQGMINFISTSVHSNADIWITYAYNKIYDNKVKTAGLVHSDDSWVCVACNSIDDFKRFSIFRMVAKKLFCLKLNEKKLWGSRFLGEMLSNYNINGNVHLPVSKMVSNSFCNLMYQNWVIDVHNQISCLQQAYRSGANIPTLIMLKTILREQMLSSYQVKGRQLELLEVLPVELGGFPNLSAFELSVNGVNAHYVRLVKYYGQNPDCDAARIVKKSITLSVLKNKGTFIEDEDITKDVNKIKKYREQVDEEFKPEDYETVSVGHRGDIFTCIKHLMPKGKKINKTLERIKELPFQGNGLEMIITRPKELSVSLGNFKNQTATALYALAAEHYTQSSRRLAVSQVMQSSGKVIKLLSYNAMTYNEFYDFMLESDVREAWLENLQVAFADDSNIPEICDSIVYHSTYNPIEVDTRKVINKMPNIEDKFTTISRLQNVLLYMVDRCRNSNLLETYGNQPESSELLEKDANLIETRFNIYFIVYSVEYACNLIMQQYLYATKSRLWMQPYLRSDTLETFLCDLYGKSISFNTHYRVEIDYSKTVKQGKESRIVNTIYTTLVLNKIYEGKFKPVRLGDEVIEDVLRTLDYATLSSEDFLKYSVIMKDLYNEDQHLRYYDEQKVYDQYYLKPQRVDASGRYFGDFRCLVQYNKTVLLIEGTPENINLTTNNTDINSILFAMMMFIRYNFPFYRYQSPNQWNTCSFWKSDNTFTHLWLTSFGTCVTYLTSTQNYGSIPIVLNKNLQMVKTYNKVLGDSYYCDEALRNVYKKVDNKEIKMASVKQTLSCPFSDLILVEDDLVEGLQNNDLLKNKLIINILLRRYYDNTRDEYKYVLQNMVRQTDAAPIFDMYAAIINSLVDINYDFQDYVETGEIEVFTVGEQSVSAFIAIAETVQPESLEYVETDYYTTNTDRVGRIVVQKDLKSLFFKIISGNSSDRDIEEILYLMLHDHRFAECLSKAIVKDNWDDEDIVEIIKELKDSYSIELDLETYAFLVGNSLNRPETIEKFNLSRLIETDNYRIKNDLSFSRAQHIIDFLLENVHGVDPRGGTNKLLKAIKKAKK